MAPPSPNNSVSSAHLVMFSPTTVDKLLVVTSSSEKEGGAALLKFSASNGQLLSQVHVLYNYAKRRQSSTNHCQFKELHGAYSTVVATITAPYITNANEIDREYFADC